MHPKVVVNFLVFHSPASLWVLHSKARVKSCKGPSCLAEEDHHHGTQGMLEVGEWAKPAAQVCHLCARQCGLQEGQRVVRPGVALRDDSLCVQSNSYEALRVPRRSALPGIWWFEWLQWSSVRSLWLEEEFFLNTEKKSSSCGIQLLLTSTCKSIKMLETSQLMLHKHTRPTPQLWLTDCQSF